MLVGQCRGVVIVAYIALHNAGVGLSWQRANNVRECTVRQPGDAVVVRSARIHPVTRAVAPSYASRCPTAITLVVPDGKESATRADRNVGLPLRLKGVGV